MISITSMTDNNSEDISHLAKRLIAICPDEIDLTNIEHEQQLYDAADWLLSISTTDEILSMHNLLLQEKMKYVAPLLALKMARSKQLMDKQSNPFHVSVIFAVYKEHNRIKSHKEHSHGENFLVRKVEQLRWLFSDNSNASWKLILVDDGCPEGSGNIAEEIIDSNQLEDCVQVLFLKDAISASIPCTRGLQSTADSQKGGSILYGMWQAIQGRSGSEHVVVYTDADLSTHLGQVGNLIQPVLNKGKLSAIGSRREPESVVLKAGSRNDRGKLFIYLWKRLIPNLDDIIDTQCGFKAFSATIVDDLVDDMIEKKFAFDIELLVKAQQLQPLSIQKVPIAWLDSEAASTTTDIQPYLPMLKAIGKMNRRYFKTSTETDSFARFVDGLNNDSFNKLLERIPLEITSREPAEFTDFNEVSASDLQVLIA
ncbi:MAG: hypothetical protein HKN00_09705 [Flavobacteriaceae bacterium]|nr:hypothetical protein [Flavobacteriaceae bacterium]